MQIQKANTLTSSEKLSIFNIWNSVYPVTVVYKNIEAFEEYLSRCVNATHFLAKINDDLIGWLCVFDRAGERWFALIVDGNHHKQGIGQQLLQKIKETESKVNGWIVTHDNYCKADGSPYKSPKAFYEKAGFAITDEVLQTEKLITTKITWQNPHPQRR